MSKKNGEININLIYKGLHYMYRSVPVIRLECMKMSNINDFEGTKVESKIECKILKKLKLKKCRTRKVNVFNVILIMFKVFLKSGFLLVNIYYVIS